MVFDSFSFICGFFISFLMALAIFLPKLASLKTRLKEKEGALGEMGNIFSTLAQDALQKSNEQFLQLAQERFKLAQANNAHDMEKKNKEIKDMVDPLKLNLEKLNSTVEQIKGTDNALREDIKNLNRETAKLTGALKNPIAQGRWGEYILEQLLDQSGLIKGVHYESQVSMKTEDGIQRPDVIIHLQDGFNIVVDAKAPINDYAEQLSQDISEQQFKDTIGKLAKQVRDHVRKLSQKSYWENLDSPDFVVMFLPSEHIFSATVRADPTLVDYASDNRIIIVSPTLMISLLRVVGMSWRQVELAKNAQEISLQASELYKRLSVFGGHMEKVGKGLKSAIENYNSAVGSLERKVFPQARKMESLHVQTGTKKITEIDSIETLPRQLEVVESSKKEKVL